MRIRRPAVLGVLGALVVLVAGATSANAAHSGLVISQLYGGGGNSGATYTHDFIELFNRGTAPISLNGWSVQYASAAGTSWQRTNLTDVTLQPGQYYLVQQAQGAGGTTPLPSADAAGAIAMSATAGKVALVSNQTTLTGSCPTVGIADFAGYGSANCFEGSGPAPTLSNTTAAVRAHSGCTDTDSNAADFTAAAPGPRNTATPIFSCQGDNAPSVAATTPTNGATNVALETQLRVTFSEPVDAGSGAFSLTCTMSGTHALTVGGGPTTFTLSRVTPFVRGETCTGTVHAASVTDQDSDDPPDNMVGDHVWTFQTIPPLVIRTIGEVQGSVTDLQNGRTHRSPFAPPAGNAAGQTVTVQGVIYQKTLARSSAGVSQNGFFIQNTAETADGDPTSSDGIFVFMGAFNDLIGGYVPQVGDEVVISGRVTEFFNFTQLSSARLEEHVRSFVNLDAALPAVETNPPDDLAAADRYWERLEGMRLEVPAGSVAMHGRDVFAGTADGEIWVARGDSTIAQRSDPYARRSFRDPHPLDNNGAELFDDGNGYRIMMSSYGVKAAAGDNTVLLEPARTFATLNNSPVGGLYFTFEKYAVMVEQQPDWTLGPDPSLNAPPQAFNRARGYSVANYNVENLYDFRDDPFDGCDFVGNAGCPGVNPPFNYVPASDEVYQARLRLIAHQIVHDLHSPDIVLTQEGEDQDICTVDDGELVCGATNNVDGKPDTLQELTLAIQEIGGPAYDTSLDRDGADDRGIVSGFLYRTDRVELLPAAGPVLGSSPQVEYRGAPLAYNTDVQNPKALNAVLPADVDRSTGTDGNNVYTRAPQVGLFRVWRVGIGLSTWVDLYAVSNHFSSTPNARVGQRREQAAYNAAIAAAVDRPRALLGGDLNVFPRPDDPFSPGHPQFPSDQLGPIYEQGLSNHWDRMVVEVTPASYGYVFQGQAQTLDMQFVTPTLEDELRQARVAHVNADWPAEYDGDGPRGLSDHDPMMSQYAHVPTIPRIKALVELLSARGAIRGVETRRILLDRLDRAQRYREAGQLSAYQAQLQAFENQVQGFAPRFVDQQVADALADEADLLSNS